MNFVEIDMDSLRKEYLSGTRVVALADKYGVHKQTIYNRLIELGLSTVGGFGRKGGRPLGSKKLNYHFEKGDVLQGQIKLLEPTTKERTSSTKGKYTVKAWKYEVIETGCISIITEQALRDMRRNPRKRRFRHSGKEQAGLNKLKRGYQRHARERGLVWNLTTLEFRALVLKNCFYCTVAPSQVLRANKNSEMQILYNGIDRKDNNEGYEVGNCVPCCGSCNQAKMDMSYDQFKVWLSRLVKNYENII